MKQVIALLLACAFLFSGCAPRIDDTVSIPSASAQTGSNTSPAISDIAVQENTPAFNGLNDPNLLQYVEDTLYANLSVDFASEDYIIENVNAIYYSKEYLEEIAYNSKSNIFFGYTLAELDEQFEGDRYVFTLSDDGQTNVEPFKSYDGTYNQIIKNVAIGTGVILVCVTVSVISGGIGAQTISMVFAASAKTGTAFALSSAGFSSIFTGVVTGIQTGDFNQAIKAGALAGSEGFKWSAIGGALTGGAEKALALRSPQNAASAIPTYPQSEQFAHKMYGGSTQKSYIGGKEVPYGTAGSTRPDIVREIDGHLEAIEVKNWDLRKNLNAFCNVLKQEIKNRKVNCPPGTTQRIALDVRNRGYSPEELSAWLKTIRASLADIYSDIPIDIWGM